MKSKFCDTICYQYQNLLRWADKLSKYNTNKIDDHSYR